MTKKKRGSIFLYIDIIAVLTQQKDYQTARRYWNKLAQRLRSEGSVQLVTNCRRLKMRSADSKWRDTTVADIQTLSRIIYNLFRVQKQSQ
jgi:hypothetical protein